MQISSLRRPRCEASRGSLTADHQQASCGTPKTTHVVDNEDQLAAIDCQDPPKRRPESSNVRIVLCISCLRFMRVQEGDDIEHLQHLESVGRFLDAFSDEGPDDGGGGDAEGYDGLTKQAVVEGQGVRSKGDGKIHPG